MIKWVGIAIGLTVVTLAFLIWPQSGDLEYGDPVGVYSAHWWDPISESGEFGYMAEMDLGPQSFAVYEDHLLVADTFRSRVVRVNLVSSEIGEFPVLIDAEAKRPDQLAVASDKGMWVSTTDGMVLNYSSGGALKQVFRLKPEYTPGLVWVTQRLACATESRLVTLDSWVDQEGFTRRVAVYDSADGLTAIAGFLLAPGGGLASVVDGEPPQHVLDVSAGRGRIFVLKKGTDGEYSISSPGGVCWDVEHRGKPRLLGVDDRRRVYVMFVDTSQITVLRYTSRGKPDGDWVLPKPEGFQEARVDGKGNIFLAIHDSSSYSIQMVPAK